jgi:hypothetical protein
VNRQAEATLIVNSDHGQTSFFHSIGIDGNAQRNLRPAQLRLRGLNGTSAPRSLSRLKILILIGKTEKKKKISKHFNLYRSFLYGLDMSDDNYD